MYSGSIAALASHHEVWRASGLPWQRAAVAAHVARRIWTVRDEPSRRALQPFAAAERIEIVPDTAFGIGRLLPETPSFELRRLLDANGLTGPYVVIQGVRGLDPCLRFLERHAGALGHLQFLVLPMGPVNGDDDALVESDLPGLVRLAAWPPPLRIAELIHGAAAVVGPSYHLTITALVAGIPVFTPADLRGGKFPGLAEFEGLHPLPAPETHDAGWFLSRLGRALGAPRVAAAVARVAAHWDRVAQVVEAGPTGSAVAVGRFWQSLPGVLEGHAARQQGAMVAEMGARVAEMRQRQAEDTLRIAELTRLVALARGEIAARDRRIAQLLASTSWKLTAPVRSIGRRLGR